MATSSKKLQRFWENDSLICEVKRRPPLWDIRLHEFRDLLLKATLWQEVSAAVGCTAKHAATRWRTLRDTFFRKSKEQQASQRSGAAEVVKCKWPHFYKLMFLRTVSVSKRTKSDLEGTEIEEAPHMQSIPQTPEEMVSSWINKSHGNEGVGGSESHAAEDTSPAGDPEEFTDSSSSQSSAKSYTPSSSRKRKQSPSSEGYTDRVIGVLRSELWESPPDHIEHFLMSLRDEMRRCPERLALQMKIDILRVIQKYVHEN
ncbi:uncharacterized protein LOC135396083 [Ornithodoros turicata]|uniref:uncharacterized protein LOC135396083 n=1 Tax=Ornithodoros turicata TaxID=34597 RepID=UPI0031395AC6